jgi:hypothetical protein
VVENVEGEFDGPFFVVAQDIGFVLKVQILYFYGFLG